MQTQLRLRRPSRLVGMFLIGILAAMLLSACGDNATATPNTTNPVATTAAGSTGAITAAAGVATTASATTAPVAAGPTPSPTPQLAKAGTAGTTLNYLTWGNPETVNKEFTAVTSVYPDVAKQVNLSITAMSGDGGVANTFRLALAAGKNIPDIMAINYTQLPEFAEAGELTDLTAAFDPVKGDLYKGALAVSTYNDKIMAFPREVKSKLFYYRSDLFEQAGIDITSIKTGADLIAAGKKLHEKFPKTYIMNMGPKPAGYYLGMTLSAYPDVRMADSSGKYQITSNKAFADSFKFFKDIQDAKITLPVEDFSNDWKQSFDQEAIGGVLGANWMKFFIPGNAPKQTGKWKVALWPSFAPMPDERFGAEAGGSVWVIPKRAPHAKEAIDYLSKLVLDKQVSLAYFKAGGWTPLLKSVKDDAMAFVRSATKPATVSDADWAVSPVVYFGPAFQELEFQSYDYVKPFPYDPSANKEFDILNQWFQKYLAGTPLADALKGAQSDMEGQIGNPYQK